MKINSQTESHGSTENSTDNDSSDGSESSDTEEKPLHFVTSKKFDFEFNDQRIKIIQNGQSWFFAHPDSRHIQAKRCDKITLKNMIQQHFLNCTYHNGNAVNLLIHFKDDDRFFMSFVNDLRRFGYSQI